MTKSWQLSRRTMLRALGASVALPWLEAMHPSSPLAVTPKRPKLRAGYIYFPNGVSKGSWEPEKVGRKGELRELSKWMKDLEPFKNDILIGHNIWTPRGNGHGAGTATWLTGGSYSGSRVSAGGTCMEPTSMMDMFPTFLELAGVEVKGTDSTVNIPFSAI